LIWPVMAELSSAPVIKVDGVEKTVVGVGQYSGAWDWVWQEFSVMANPAAPPSPGAVITVTFPSPFSDVAVAEDAVDIAAHGLLEAVEEVRDVPDRTALQDIADGLLARGVVTPTGATFRTDKPGLEPGHILTVNTLRPPCTELMVIESVDSEEQGKLFFRHQVKASNGPQSAANEAAFYQRLLERTKQAKDRGTFTFVFQLAETPEGGTNDGLTTGYKTPLLMAPKAGVIRDCVLRFKSVDDGTLTESLIEIDVLKDDVTVFGSKRMEYPAGATGTQSQFVFASSPVTVAQGDVFRINVLQADALAKDGTLALTVVG